MTATIGQIWINKGKFARRKCKWKAINGKCDKLCTFNFVRKTLKYSNIFHNFYMLINEKWINQIDVKWTLKPNIFPLKQSKIRTNVKLYKRDNYNTNICIWHIENKKKIVVIVLMFYIKIIHFSLRVSQIIIQSFLIWSLHWLK